MTPWRGDIFSFKPELTAVRENRWFKGTRGSRELEEGYSFLHPMASLKTFSLEGRSQGSKLFLKCSYVALP